MCLQLYLRVIFRYTVLCPIHMYVFIDFPIVLEYVCVKDMRSKFLYENIWIYLK